jgi:hypothetical protein
MFRIIWLETLQMQSHRQRLFLWQVAFAKLAAMLVYVPAVLRLEYTALMKPFPQA